MAPLSVPSEQGVYTLLVLVTPNPGSQSQHNCWHQWQSGYTALQKPLKLQKTSTQSSHWDARTGWGDAVAAMDGLIWSKMPSEATCIVIIPVSMLCSPSAPRSIDPLWACHRKRVENLRLERKFGAITLLISHPNHWLQQATLVALLGCVCVSLSLLEQGVIIRMNHPFHSCGLLKQGLLSVAVCRLHVLK